MVLKQNLDLKKRLSMNH